MASRARSLAPRARPGREVSSQGAPVWHGEPCKTGKRATLAVKLRSGWDLRGRGRVVRSGYPGRARAVLIGGTPWPRRTTWATATSPGVRAESSGKRPNCAAGKTELSQGRGRSALGANGADSGGGCLRVGTRVRMESRVVGVAGFWPGTPEGASGPPGPRGDRRKTAFWCPHLEDFTPVTRGSHVRG